MEKQKKTLTLKQVNSTESDEYMPPIDVRWFVQTLLSEEVRGNKTKAERITGVDKGKFYWHFNRFPEFRKWFSEQCDAFLSRNQAIVSSMLMKKISEGDVQAIRTYFELVGKLKSHNILVDQSQHITQIFLANKIKEARERRSNDKVITAESAT